LGIVLAKTQMPGLPVEMNFFEDMSDMIHGPRPILSENPAVLNRENEIRNFP
jgi:hypothetical protein